MRVEIFLGSIVRKVCIKFLFVKLFIKVRVSKGVEWKVFRGTEVIGKGYRSIFLRMII